ncbi:MAG TPA: hypothetical protein VK590_11450, partial [Saprospiraceae bacterium]|nr:hypothetical protein [Saprospiraceae bacterium]
IDLDIQKQGSLSIRINRILKRLMFGTVNENVLPISVRQCIDLLQSLSHNESYISGTKQLTEAINQMANAPYEKLLILNDLEPLAVNSTSAPYKSRNTIITELEDHYKLMLENYFEPGLSTDANESELEIHVVHAERNLNKYLNNYVEFSIRYIISRVNEDLSVFIDRDKFNYTKTLESFREVTITARKALKKELWSKLSDYIQLIKTRINTNFNTFDKMLETEQKEIEFLYKNINNIDRSLTELSHILINKS